MSAESGSQAHSSPRNYRNRGVDLLPNIGFYTHIPLVGISNTYSRLKNDNLRIIIKSKRIKSYRFEFEVSTRNRIFAYQNVSVWKTRYIILK